MHERYKVSKKQFKLFKEMCEWWIESFGIGNWSVEIVLRDDESDDGCLAWTLPNSLTCRAVIGLCETWALPITNDGLRRVALHEVLHLVLALLMEKALSRFTTEEDLKRIEHDVIRQMGKAIYGSTKADDTDLEI